MNFSLLIGLLIKHAVCDFPLQTNWMQGKNLGGLNWVLPLFAHSIVTALGTLIVFLIVNPHFWYFAAIDLVLHFGIDRMKSLAGPSDLSRIKGRIAFAADQLSHQLCYVGYVYLIFKLGPILV